MVRQYTAWTKDEAGSKVKLWRMGKTKYFPALQWVSEIKFLGIKAGYGPFEMQTLWFRNSEAKPKLHQVRKCVYNRRVASTMSRHRVWQTVVWLTLSFGLAEVGLSMESARALKAWYAYKIRSVLNKPAHVSRVTTQELFDMYSVEDPISRLEKLQANRHGRLCAQHISVPNITNTDHAVRQSKDNLHQLRQFSSPPQPDAGTDVPEIPCAHCDKTFASELGLRLHTAKVHPDTVRRFVPRSFDRLKHAIDGVPNCRACQASFKHWPGLTSHLLSGTCPCLRNWRK